MTPPVCGKNGRSALHHRKRRPTACIPCHQRKVRCDAATNGTPCSRCISKDVAQGCTLVPPRASKRGSTRPQTHPLNSTRGRKNSSTRLNRASVTDAADSFGTIGSPVIPDERTQFHEPQGPAPEILSYQSITTPTSNITGESLRNSHTSVPNYAVSEEDAHVQTLHRMTDGNDAIPSPAGISDEPHNYEVVEYFDNLNSVSILGEALGRRQTRRLIQLDLSPRHYASAEQRALSNLDPADADYLCSRGVFKTPPRAAWSVYPSSLFEAIKLIIF
ncbi:hypothetical protein N7528_006433 [Penicillium herquei]|nr:hypothetical protein N7528_006433 [Penicillium herquei]